MSSNTVAIIQARVGSSRLSGKIFADICGKPMLQRVYEQVRRAKLLDNVVVATSWSAADAKIASWGHANGMPVYRGGQHVNDVLGRYYDVALRVGADVIVRITADCPLIDPVTLDLAIESHMSTKFSYISNTDPPSYPDGLDVEVFDMGLLRQAHLNATTDSDREHVTPWMRRAVQPAVARNVFRLPDLSHLRWTVDQAEDLEFVRAVYTELGEDFGMGDVLALLERRPELTAINGHIGRNEGYREEK